MSVDRLLDAAPVDPPWMDDWATPALRDDLDRLNATTEEQLLVGATRTELCACGGYITAQAHPDAIRGAVMEHQATPRHRRYRLRFAERDAHANDIAVPDELLLRGRRCPCGGHS